MDAEYGSDATVIWSDDETTPPPPPRPVQSVHLQQRLVWTQPPPGPPQLLPGKLCGIGHGRSYPRPGATRPGVPGTAIQ